MAAFTKKFVITAIGGSSVTLTPQIGTNSSGPVTGTLPTSDPDCTGGLSTVVLNMTTPDAGVFKRVGTVVTLHVDVDTTT